MNLIGDESTTKNKLKRKEKKRNRMREPGEYS